ncbi:hypothetical protein ACIOGT_38200 [Streptomyces microflavus]|uniref:hypothetical protein n=1 Tax=Streptomyces microflavus TaxID=1919 RepID=UPI0037FBE2CF
MSARGRSYRYVKPVELKAVVRPGNGECRISSAAEFGDWIAGQAAISFVREADRWAVVEVSNHSTGYCPDIGSWSEVARALDDVGLERPSGFTHKVVFRRCPGCQERNIVREDDFVCVFCGSDLPERWNADPTA